MLRSALIRLSWSLAVLVGVHAVTYWTVALLALRRYGQATPPRSGDFRRLVSASDAAPDASLTDAVAAYGGYLSGFLPRAGPPDGTAAAEAYGAGVWQLVAEALPRSLLLLASAVAIAAVLGLVLGYLGVDRRRGRARPAIYWLNVVGFSAPAFYVGILAIQALFLARRVSGARGTWFAVFGSEVDLHLALPVLALALRPTAEMARLTAEGLVEQLRLPHLRTAAAKGAGWRRSLLRHALPNVMAPLWVQLGNAARYLVGSLVIVELLFNWPGVGRMLAMAIAPRVDGRLSARVLYDPALVAALVTALAALSLGLTFTTSLLARSADPRLRRP